MQAGSGVRFRWNVCLGAPQSACVTTGTLTRDPVNTPQATCRKKSRVVAVGGTCGYGWRLSSCWIQRRNWTEI